MPRDNRNISKDTQQLTDMDLTQGHSLPFQNVYVKEKTTGREKTEQ